MAGRGVWGFLGRLPASRRYLLLAALMISLLVEPVQTARSPLWTLVGGTQRYFAGELPYLEGGPYAVSGAALHSLMRAFPGRGWRRVVVIVPHMDDETLFLGETLAALDSAGVDVTLLYTTTSQGGRKMDPRFRQDRLAAYRQVARVLGVDRTVISDIPDGAPMGGFDAKAGLTQRFLEGTDAIQPGSVLFTIGGRGHYDHWIAEYVGRQMAQQYNLPLFVYWGYGPTHKYVPASDKHWGPQMRPVDFSAGHSAGDIDRKRQAIIVYRDMYYARGWARYWVSISIYELAHQDEVGLVPKPLPSQ